MKVRIPKRTAVLLYLPEALPEREAIRTALQREGLPVSELSALHFPLTVQECFEGKATEAPAENAPGEALAIFCNVSDGALDGALAALRGLPVMKAVMTPANRAWSLRSLYEELCREREAIRQRREQNG